MVLIFYTVHITQFTYARFSTISRSQRQPPTILSSTPHIVSAPRMTPVDLVTAGCWQINDILSNIGRTILVHSNFKPVPLLLRYINTSPAPYHQIGHYMPLSPVFKKGSIHHAANYRPVSLTCVACKHIVMLEHLENHKLLTSLQHGFRRGHSCETQLLLILDDFFSTYDRKLQTDVGIWDFSCAFDTVPHKRLLGKLASNGINGPLNTWIRAFLTGRSMSVTMDGVTSYPAPVLSGVPQGTVLGPLLLLIYINNMPEVVSDGTFVRLFADDCLVYRPIHSDQGQITLQRDLTALQYWADQWGMRFNPKKCYIMHFHRCQMKPWIYELCGEVLFSVVKAKYLGVLISNDLNWHEQVC